MKISSCKKIESLVHGERFDGRLKVLSLWFGTGHLNLVCSTAEGKLVRVKSFFESGHFLNSLIIKLMPKIPEHIPFFRLQKNLPSSKILNFGGLIAQAVPSGKRSHTSDLDMDLLYTQHSTVICGNKKSISHAEICKIHAKCFVKFQNLIHGNYCNLYGLVKESFHPVECPGAIYLSAKIGNGKNQHVTLNVIKNAESEKLLGLGLGVELLIFGRVHIDVGRSTRIFVNDPRNIQIQKKRIFQDHAFFKVTNDPQKRRNCK